MFHVRWDSYDHSGRKRPRPPPSTIHGWLMKWRGTFAGDEDLRRQGIREMREAKARRAARRQKNDHVDGSGKKTGGGAVKKVPQRPPTRQDTSKSKQSTTSIPRQSKQSASRPPQPNTARKPSQINHGQTRRRATGGKPAQIHSRNGVQEGRRPSTRRAPSGATATRGRR